MIMEAINSDPHLVNSNSESAMTEPDPYTSELLRKNFSRRPQDKLSQEEKQVCREIAHIPFFGP